MSYHHHHYHHHFRSSFHKWARTCDLQFHLFSCLWHNFVFYG
jgi:hypothetical protein